MRAVPLLLLPLFWLPVTPATAADDLDEEMLRGLGVGIDGRDLTAFLRDRCPDRIDSDRIDRLVRRLADTDAASRATAAAELVRIGPAAKEGLRRAAEGDTPAAVAARDCLERIDRQGRMDLVGAAVRVLARKAAKDTAEALLAVLPHADEGAVTEIYYLLDTLVVRGGKAPQALLEALKDREPARRAAAACVLGWRGGPAERAAAAGLLKDPSPLVRLRAGQGLLAARDKVGLPALVGLLDEADTAIAWQAEELLRWAARETAPAEVVGAGGEAGRLCKAAWQQWQRTHFDRLDVSQRGSDGRWPGLLLVVDVARNPEDRQTIWLHGSDGTRRWSWQTPRRVCDFQLLPGNRLLLFECGAPDWNGLVLRDLTGKLVWRSECALRSGVIDRPLPNGHIFATDDYGNYEFDAAGKVVLKHRIEGPTELQGIKYHRGMSTCALPNGRFTWMDRVGRIIVECDPVSGEVVRSARVDALPFPDRFHFSLHVAEVLPSGHYVIRTNLQPGPEPWTVHLDRDGKVVAKWREKVHFPLVLRNGNRVGTYWRMMGIRELVELDAKGRTVWEDMGDADGVRLCLPLLRFGFDTNPEAPVDLDSVAHRVKELRHKDEKFRYRSAMLLGLKGTEARSAVPAVFDALPSLSGENRGQAVGALRDLLAPESLPDVLTAAQHQNPIIRETAVEMLHKFRDRPRDILPGFLKALEDDNALVRRRAVGLGYWCRNEKETIPALVKALKDKDTATIDREMSVAQRAADTLGSCGALAIGAIPALLEATNAADERLRRSAVLALGEMAKRDETAAATIVPELTKFVEDKPKKTPLRREAIWALAGLGPRAKAAVPVLRIVLQQTDFPDPNLGSNVGSATIGALGQIGADAKDAVPELLALLQDVKLHARYRAHVADSLGQIGPSAKVAIPALESLSVKAGEDSLLRDAATAALRKIRR